MQFHACLLLFLVTTGNILAWSDQHCGGNVSLDQKPSGHIKLSLPGLFNDTSTLLNPTNQQSDNTSQPLSCTWVLDIPLERTVLLKLVWLDGVSRVSLRCEEVLVLQSGDTVLLSSCDRNKATLSWTGAGRSSDSFQLVYYVQENERNSLEVHSTQNPTGGSQTGTTIKNITVAEEVVRGTKEGRGRLHEDLVWSFGPQFVSSASSPDEGPLPSTSPQQGLPVSGRADRETLSLPEEKTNNGADTSGASHLIDDPTSARTRPSFQHSVSEVQSQTENPTLTQTEMSWTDAKITPFGADLHKSTHRNLRVSSTSAFPTISPSEMPTLESSTIPYPHGGAKFKDEQAFSWTSQQNTDKLNSDLTSAISSNPLKPSTKYPQHDSSSAITDIQPTLSSSSSASHDLSRTHSPHTHIAEPDTTVPTVEAASVHPHTNQSDSFLSDVRNQTAASESSDEKLENTDVLHTFASSTQSQTDSPESTERLINVTSSPLPQTVGETTNTIPSSPDKDDGQTSSSTTFFSTPRAAQRTKIQNSTPTATTRATYTSPFTHAVLHDNSPTDLTTSDSSTPSYTTQTHSEFPDTLTYFAIESSTHTTFVDQQTIATLSQTSHSSNTRILPSSTNIPTYKQSQEFITTAFTFKNEKFWQWFPTRATKQTPSSGPTLHPSQQTRLDLTPSALTPTPSWRSTSSPLFYIVPNQAATIRVEMIELLLQIVVDESRSASSPGLEEDTAAWVQPYLQKAPGFIKLLGVWSSGRAVQSLVLFKTSGALQWLSASEPTSLLQQTGLAQAVHEGRMFRSSKITNITLGGLQGDVCDWLLQCPAGYKCIPEPGTTNYSCSSLCRFDYCHHHGICTHHPGQLPVCRCLVGDDFWYMGQRCDMRMTRMRLVGACLAILLIIATVIGILAFVAVRRYRAILIQAKVDQTRSSYRRFNHFDELSGRFWLRSWAGSADSLDNPAFTRSDELLHLRALDRPCCYHDDTLSLSSTCPSHGARLNTIYPHSSQYGWRGSEMSMGDVVLDSGKASDLSVCSWPVEPIHWTPFPLLQQLASHRTPTVRVSRPRSYCEGMELVDLGKSWTA